MSAPAWMLLGVFLGSLVLLAWPGARWVERCFEPDPQSRLAHLEARLLRLCGADADEDMPWTRYALALILFNALGAVALYLLQRVQGVLPLDPQGFPGVGPDSAFNTALSFVSNTDWQGYAGESTMSHLTQMLGLTVQNFLSAATGLAVLAALTRGFRAHQRNGLGSAWADLLRITLRLLLPLSLVLAVLFCAQGVVQDFSAGVDAQLLEVLSFETPKVDAQGTPLQDAAGKPTMQAQQTRTQTIPLGPVASQEAIKMLGTNGGGFFNANSAHPFENPSPLTDFVQMLAIFLLPAASCLAFGRLVGDPRQGWALLVAMTLIFAPMAVTAMVVESGSVPGLAALGIDAAPSALQSGGNLEGKETRFGAEESALFATVTTSASCGAVNAMHDSLLPLGGLVPLVMMQLGEVVFGGVGSGLYGMLVFAVTAVFLAGLMIGRTPEYLGKKIEPFEMKMVALAILVTPLLVLFGTALAVSLDAGVAGIANPGAHGYSEILYAFTSSGNNNGSAFAGLSANTPFYNVSTGLVMWFGRFAMVIPVLGLAGSLARKKRLGAHLGTLPTHGPLFIVVLIATVLLVGLLNYVPALALGPVVEHLQLFAAHP